MEKKYSCILFSALGLMVALFIIVNLKTVMKIDDDYIGEQVFWLLKEGKVKSELMRGYGNIGLENYQSVFHKLFIYAGAAVSKVFGWSLHSLHFVSAFFTFVSIIALYLFCRKNYSLYVFPAALLCMLSFNEFINFSFSFRPEIMIVALGFISYFFLDEYLKNKKHSFLMASSVFAGLAFLTHLNGLIFVAAGAILLLICKDIKAMLLFSGISVLVFLPLYFFDVFKNASLSYFLFQFRHDPSLNDSNFNIFTPAIRLFREHYRLFRSPMEITLTVLFTFSLIVVIKNAYARHKNLILYTLILMLTLAVYSYSKTHKYIILYLPFLALIISLAGETLLKSAYTKKGIRMTYYVLFGLFGITGLIFTGRYALQIHKQADLVASNKKAADLIPEKDKQYVLAPGEFIFNEIKHFERIMNLNRFAFFIESHHKERINFEELIDSARYYKINYILFSDEYSSYFKLNENLIKLNELNERIYLFGQTERYYILKLAYD